MSSSGEEFESLPRSLPRADLEASDRRLADRLDGLETEKVIRRAMELEESSVDPTESFSPEDLERIAAELGISPQFVRQAIAEVRSGHADRSRVDRLLIPEEMAVQESIRGVTRDQLDRMVTRWMREYEGLMPTGRVASGIEWEMDRNALIRLRTAMTSGANRMSASVPGPIWHRVASVQEDEHVVTLSAEDRQPLLLAKGGTAVGVLAAVGTLVGGAVDGDLAAVLIGTPVVGGGIVAGSVIGARMWAQNMKKALRRSLTGMTSQPVPPRPKLPTLPWRRKKKDS